jgi:hypothetical protein
MHNYAYFCTYGKLQITRKRKGYFHDNLIWPFKVKEGLRLTLYLSTIESICCRESSECEIHQFPHSLKYIPHAAREDPILIPAISASFTYTGVSRSSMK